MPVLNPSIKPFFRDQLFDQEIFTTKCTSDYCQRDCCIGSKSCTRSSNFKNFRNECLRLSQISCHSIDNSSGSSKQDTQGFTRGITCSIGNTINHQLGYCFFSDIFHFSCNPFRGYEKQLTRS